VGGTSQDRGGSQISERTFDHGRTFLKRVDVRFGSKADILLGLRDIAKPDELGSAVARPVCGSARLE
jgi:hypothetical protein